MCEEAGRSSIGLALHSEVAAQNNGQKRREARQKLQKAESLCRENGHPPPGDTPKIVYLCVCVCALVEWEGEVVRAPRWWVSEVRDRDQKNRPSQDLDEAGRSSLTNHQLET